MAKLDLFLITITIVLSICMFLDNVSSVTELEKGQGLAEKLKLANEAECGKRPIVDGKQWEKNLNRMKMRNKNPKKKNKPKAHHRLLHGNATFYAEHPSYAMIHTGGADICGGVLVGRRTVLTSTGCLEKLKLDDMKVLLGFNADYVYTHIDTFPHTYKVASASHDRKACNDATSKIVKNDILVLTLDEDVFYHETTQPACLPTTFSQAPSFHHPNDKDEFEIVGRGMLSGQRGFDYAAGPSRRILVSPDMCGAHERSHYSQVDKSVKCYGSIDSNVCNGDFGSPVYYYRRDEETGKMRQYVAGIVSTTSRAGCVSKDGQNFGVADWLGSLDSLYESFHQNANPYNYQKDSKAKLRQCSEPEPGPK